MFLQRLHTNWFGQVFVAVGKVPGELALPAALFDSDMV